MRVLIADDDRDVAAILARFVRECHHEVVEVVTNGGLATIQSFAKHLPDLVFLDIRMPKYNGFTVCQQLLSRDPELKVILISGSVGADYPSVIASRASAYLQKPFRFEAIRDLLQLYSGVKAVPEGVAVEEIPYEAVLDDELPHLRLLP